MTGFLTMVFAWRATVTWLAVSGGNSQKLVAAALITSMGLASILTLYVILAAGGARPDRHRTSLSSVTSPRQ
jgi:hypothetical protein